MLSKTIKDYFITLTGRVIKDDFFGMAAEMAYMFALGIFPLITFISAIFSWLGKKYFVDSVIVFFQDFVPHDVIGLMTKVMEEVILFKNSGFWGIFGLVVTIALASNIIYVMIKGLNRAYNLEEKRSIITTRILSVLMVFANAMFLFLCVNLIIFGKVILKYVFLYSNVQIFMINFISIIRWPIAFLVLYLMAALNYYILPAVTGTEKIKRQSTVYGTLFFCIFWLLGSALFSVYIDNLNTYNRVYGALGAFAILLVWLYYTSLILLIGGEINSTTYGWLLSKENKKS